MHPAAATGQRRWRSGWRDRDSGCDVTASLLVYGGALAALLGPAVVARARRRTGRPWGGVAALAALVGIVLALLGLALPSRDTVVAPARTRLDAVMPRYQFRERHALAAAAPPLAVDRAIRTVTADEIPLYRALTWLRRMGRRAPEGLLNAPPATPMLALAPRTGFRLLADERGRVIVLGVAGPASPAAGAAGAATRDTGPRPFTASAEGYASIAVAFRVEPDGRGGAIVSTETRVFAPDAPTRRRLATYWRLIYPGSALIRRGWLLAIRRRAEESAR